MKIYTLGTVWNMDVKQLVTVDAINSPDDNDTVSTLNSKLLLIFNAT